ncbi:unnamed protein product [Camellia sinensis]
MALTGIALQLRPKHRAIQNPSFIYFSSSTSDSNVGNQNTLSSSQYQFQSQSSLYSYFSDVRASLKQQQSPQQKYRQQPSKCSLSSSQTPSEVASLEDIRKNRSGFRRRSAVPTPEDKSSSSSPPLPPSQPISFQELCKRNVISKGEISTNEASIGGRYAIRESLKQHRSLGKNPKEPLRVPPPLRCRSARGLMIMRRRRDKQVASLEEIRKNFSEFRCRSAGGQVVVVISVSSDVSTHLIPGALQVKCDIKRRKFHNECSEARYLSGQFGGTPNFMLAPLKEQLVEKGIAIQITYHPRNRNMSFRKSEMNLKCPESDCESACVQGNTF